jgi:hypothetical protein
MIPASQLARAYDLSVASLWRGDATDNRFLAWLDRFRVADAPPEPETTPDAVSPPGAAGAGIRWYTTPTAVLGYVAGRPGVCYRVPIDANLPQPRRATAPDPVVAADAGGLAAMG